MSVDTKNVKDEQPKKNYNYLDFIQFEPQNKQSSFGVMPLSNLNTNPIYGFGTADRVKIQKQFLNEQMARTYLLGKESIGPNYNVTDKFSYNRGPTHQIGTEVRRDLSTEAKFDHYYRQDQEFEPIEADHFRKQRSASTRIGLQSRFQNDPKSMRGTPGPQYNPSLKPEIPNSENFSFGYRRDYPGFSCLQPLVSTPNVVGPGSYIIQQKPDTSNIITKPKYSFTRSIRKPINNVDFTLSQTYSNLNSVGIQQESKKNSNPIINIGKEKRSAKTGFFQQNMAMQQTKVKINMPSI